MSTTTTNEQIEKVIYDALESFGVERSELTPETKFQSIDLDSLDLAELSQVLDDEFAVVLKGEDMKKITSVGDVVSTVVAKI